MNEQREPKVFVRKYKDGAPLLIVRIYVKWLPFLTNPDIAMFRNEIATITDNVVNVRLYDFYVALEWMPSGDRRQDDVTQEVLIRSFVAFLQKCRHWQYVEREDFEFDQLEGVARREDRLLEWHPTA